MFKLRETQETLDKVRRDKVELELENDRLKKKIATLEDNLNIARKEIEDEHLENYNQHRIILETQRHINKPYGDYTSAVAIIKNIKKELSINT